jgi:hypothetical protein
MSDILAAVLLMALIMAMIGIVAVYTQVPKNPESQHGSGGDRWRPQDDEIHRPPGKSF